MGNTDKEREYLMRALCHAQFDYQEIAAQKFLDILDNKYSDDDNNGPVTPPPTAFAENLIGR